MLAYVAHIKYHICLHRKRLTRECDGISNPATIEEERARVMNSTNPAIVLRNYIVQNAIEWAENGEFSEVRGPFDYAPYAYKPFLKI